MENRFQESEIIKMAMRTYIDYSHNTGHFDMDEFKDDYQRIGFIIKLLGIYDKRQQINVRLILNHMVILYNEFGNKATEFLVYSTYNKNKSVLPHLKALLKFFHRLPEDQRLVVFGELFSFSKYKENKEISQIIEETLTQ